METLSKSVSLGFPRRQQPRKVFLIPLILIWFLFLQQNVIIKLASATPTPIMTFPNEGVYSLFPQEDLRTGKRNFRFDDEVSLNSNRNFQGGPAGGRERQLSDRYRFRGDATFINSNSNANDYIVRPLDNGYGRPAVFDDDRVRRPPNYIQSYRDRNLPFDGPNPIYLPPSYTQTSLLRPVLPAFFPEPKLPPRRAMTNDLSTPTIHIYDPASQSFVPKNRVQTPDPRLNVKPGRLLIPGFHNSLGSSEEPGPDVFLNHDEYLDYHTNIALDDLAELDRKMKVSLNNKKNNAVAVGNNNEARVVLFNPVSRTKGETGIVEHGGGGSYESGSLESTSESLEGSGDGIRPEVQGGKSKVVSVTYPIVATTNTAQFGQHLFNKEVKASKAGAVTQLSLTELEMQGGFKPLKVLPAHLKDEASHTSRSQPKPKAVVVVGTTTKAVKSELGTEIKGTMKDKNVNVNAERVPSSSLSPPPIQQTKSSSSSSQPPPPRIPTLSQVQDSEIEIIPSIVTQSSSTITPSGFSHTSFGDGLVDGHFEFVNGVAPESITFNPSPYDEGFDAANYRSETETPFLYMESKQFSKMKSDDTKSKKTILVKRIKNSAVGGKDEGNSTVTNITNSLTRSSHQVNSSTTSSKKEYETTMTVHKIQDSSEEKSGVASHGLFSAERAADFNLQGQSSSDKGVVSKIHAHISNCPKLDGPAEIICDVHIRKRHGNRNPHLTVGWKRKFYNVTQPDVVVAVNKTLAYEEDFHDKFNVTLAPGINPMLRSVLLIRHVAPADTGNYQCEVSDGENYLKSETLLFLCH